MPDWAIGLSTGCFYQTSILQCLEEIRAAGFSELEICSFPKHLDYHDMALVQRAAGRIEDLGLEAYSLHAPFAPHIDITSLDAGTREKALEEILRAATAAAALGVKHFVIHPGPEKGDFAEHERMRRMENAASVLTRASHRCRELGIHLVLENMLPHLFAGRIQDMLWILGAMETVDVGVCIDTGHAFLAGELATIAQKLSSHLWMVHASDNRGQFDDHLAPGDGEINWEEFLHHLAEIRFGGTIILEIAGTGTSTSILQAAQRGRKHLSGVARRLNESKSWMLPKTSIP
jgi:sugar phosphate isomerase/epimerase